jgi:hypothetical protein
MTLVSSPELGVRLEGSLMVEAGFGQAQCGVG